MTVVAFRDGVLAADTLVTDPPGNINGRRSKIGRHGEARWGLVGDIGGSDALLEWMIGGRKGQQPNHKAGGTLIWIPDIGRGRIYTGGRSWPIPDAPFHAWGSGCDHARGAMHMGATAVQAVEAACALEVWCGGPVETVT